MRSLRSPKTLEDAIVLFSDDALCQAVVVECRWSAVGWEHWLPALWMLVNGTVRMSSHRLADAFGVTQKTAWFMLARLRTALKDTAAPGPGDPRFLHPQDVFC